MHIYLGQPLTNVIQESAVVFVKNPAYREVQGGTFTYLFKTDENGIVYKVVARPQTNLIRFAPASYFIQNANSCTKKLLFRIPLKMTRWEYICPQGSFEYTTFGKIGEFITEAKMVKQP